MPDASFTIESMIAEKDIVAERWTLRGTHGGEFMGILATGKTVKADMMSFNVLVDGKIVERWRIFDSLDIMQQLGGVPPGRGEQKKAEYYKGKEVKGREQSSTPQLKGDVSALRLDRYGGQV